MNGVIGKIIKVSNSTWIHQRVYSFHERCADELADNGYTGDLGMTGKEPHGVKE